MSTLGVVIAAYLALYPVVLIFPFLLLSFKVMIVQCIWIVRFGEKRVEYPILLLFFLFLPLQRSKTTGIMETVLLLTLWSACLVFVSFKIAGSWEFLSAVYGVM